MVPKPKLLIVDDEPDTCANLADIFTDIGYEVDVAHHGAAALELVRHNAYDVALVDLRMPGMDGMEVCRQIRQISAGTVPIVVSAYAGAETESALVKQGVWKVLSKPVDLPRLMGLVNQALDEPLVLVVDDDEELADSLWDVLRESGYRACLAHDVRQADQRLVERNYQVVIVDMKLPHGNGGDVVKLVQQRNPAARCVIVTGYPAEMNEGVQHALDAGAKAVCYKPFNVPRLLHTIRDLVSP